MKLNFSKFVGWPWAKSLPLLAGLILSPLAVMAAGSEYTNNGYIIFYPPIPLMGHSANTVSAPPQVDATNFYNSGIWDISTSPKPYNTANTLNYTNEGSMYGSVGWDFALYPSATGQRAMSSSFFNDNNGIIQAVDDSVPNPGSLYSYLVSYLLISATNIVNKGQLIGDSAGEILLTGSTVNLSRGTLNIGSIAGVGSRNNINTANFTPDTAIYDEYWGQNGLTNNSSQIWDGTNAGSTTLNIHVANPCNGTNLAPGISLSPPAFADSTTNMVAGSTTLTVNNSDGSTTNILNVPTNIFRQAVFVGISDTNIVATNKFLSTGNPTNLFRIATVRLTDLASGETLYLQDTLASSTNRGVLKNNGDLVPGSDPKDRCTGQTYRPANYILSRSDPGSFANGMPGAGPPAFDFLYAPQSFPPDGFTNGEYGGYSGFNYSTNNSVQGEAAAYEAYVDDLVRDPPGAAVTNLPGRIVINADNLDLTRATIVSGGAGITIQAGNLTGTPTLVSGQNLSYNLGSTNGYLNVTNFASQSTLPGLNGYVSAWSDLWTNTLFQVITNPMNYATTNGWISSFQSPLTNSIQMEFHVLLVDATGLSSTVQVKVQNLILNSTNMVVSDSMDVMQTLLFDGQSLTLQGRLRLDPSGNLQNWTYANAPYLRYFTNNGTLTIPQDAHFGDDGPMNYAAFVNNGEINVEGGGLYINSDYFQNNGTLGGTLYAPGGFFLTTSNGVVTNKATIDSFGGDVDFTGGTLKLAGATIYAFNHLNFNLTNALYDGSSSVGNTLTCGNGFSLLSASNAANPNFIGDLLGTTIISRRKDGAEVDHVWAGVDRGATQAGFSNNVAIGTLVLTDLNGPTNVNSEPLFAFSGAGTSNGLYVNTLDLSGLVDFANEIQVDPNLVIYYITVIGPTAGQLAADFPGSFVQVTGVTPIGYTGNILRSPKLSAGVVGSGQQFQLTVNGTAGQTYILQASTNLMNNWVNIYTGTPPFTITNAANYPARFYQIVPGP